MLAKRCLVAGHVQGVWYRDSTRRKALQLGVSGRANNLADGRVEVIACGEAEAVNALCDWLWQGSDLSQVSDVECEDYHGPKVEGFQIG